MNNRELNRLDKEVEEIEIKDKAIIKLQKLMPVNSIVYCILRNVSQSGMSRVIDLKLKTDSGIFIMPLNLLEDIGYHYKYDYKRQGFKIGGCGMDMGFALVHSLSSLVYRGGYTCLGESKEWGKSCPASDHVNGFDREYTPHLHKNDDYALKHEWI